MSTFASTSATAPVSASTSATATATATVAWNSFHFVILINDNI
jgi:hypothetical protein